MCAHSRVDREELCLVGIEAGRSGSGPVLCVLRVEYCS